MNATPDDETVRSRLEDLGVVFDDDAWEALPGPARRRLGTYPMQSEVDRRSLHELARWLTDTFPPGWSHAR
jgi:hypothetical protein